MIGQYLQTMDGLHMNRQALQRRDHAPGPAIDLRTCCCCRCATLAVLHVAVLLVFLDNDTNKRVVELQAVCILEHSQPPQVSKRLPGAVHDGLGITGNSCSGRHNDDDSEVKHSLHRVTAVGITAPPPATQPRLQTCRATLL